MSSFDLTPQQRKRFETWLEHKAVESRMKLDNLKTEHPSTDKLNRMIYLTSKVFALNLVKLILTSQA